MTNVILVAHILVSIVLVIVVLMQRSEGGALGIGGGGGGGGGIMSSGGVKGALVRTTIIFGAIFFISSLTLTTLATNENADNRTDVGIALEEGQPDQPVDDELNIEGLEDILSTEGDILEDPLAADPTETVPEAEPDTTEGDPLATDADPQ
ncbi:MAG: preprotein translocase subunit SecG [Pseudomonadota bacterium]